MSAFKDIVRKPKFSLSIVLMMGFGIFACVSVFSIVDSMIFNALPCPDPDRLVSIEGTIPGENLHLNLSRPQAIAV